MMEPAIPHMFPLDEPCSLQIRTGEFTPSSTGEKFA